MAPAMFGRSDNPSNVSMEALVSTSLAGNLMKSFLKSYSALTTSVNASRTVALPTFIAIPAFEKDPPCAKRYSPMAKTFSGGMQFLNRVSSLCSL